MMDLQNRIATLKRPQLLARAARFGVDDYRRTVHLGRLLGGDTLPRHGPAIIALLELEETLNTKRKTRAGDYSPARHVDVLIALIGEAQLMRATALRVA